MAVIFYLGPCREASKPCSAAPGAPADRPWSCSSPPIPPANGRRALLHVQTALHPSFASRSISIARSCRGSPKSTHTTVFYRPSSAPAPARPPCAYCLLESMEIFQRRLEGMERATAISPAAQARAQEIAGF